MSSGVGSVVPKQNPPTTSAGHESIVSRSDLPVVGVDLGGTKIAAGLVDDDGGMRCHRVVETPVSSADAVITAIESLVREVTEGTRIRAVGVGAPGMISADRSRVVYAPNLPLTDVDLGRALARRLGVPVTVDEAAPDLLRGVEDQRPLPRDANRDGRRVHARAARGPRRRADELPT